MLGEAALRAEEERARRGLRPHSEQGRGLFMNRQPTNSIGDGNADVQRPPLYFISRLEIAGTNEQLQT